MTMNRDLLESRKMKFGYGAVGAFLAMALFGTNAWGQTANTASGEKEVTTLRQDNPNFRVDTRPYQTFYLSHVTTQNEANEIVVAIRNLLSPMVKIFLVPGQNAISMRATPEEMAQVQKIINDLDRQKKTYRLTFTISEMDNGKRIGVQHFAMIVSSGQRTVAKQGSRVPMVTGSTTDGNTQVQYVDIGLNFNATLNEVANGAELSAKVEVTNVAEERSGVGPQDPVLRQTILDSTSFLQPGKPLVLGSLDVPGSMRHLDIDVMMEPIVP
jgi:type II secretory pathway component GspD/PulD (secretin)